MRARRGPVPRRRRRAVTSGAAARPRSARVAHVLFSVAAGCRRRAEGRGLRMELPARAAREPTRGTNNTAAAHTTRTRSESRDTCSGDLEPAIPAWLGPDPRRWRRAVASEMAARFVPARPVFCSTSLPAAVNARGVAACAWRLPSREAREPTRDGAAAAPRRDAP